MMQWGWNPSDISSEVFISKLYSRLRRQHKYKQIYVRVGIFRNLGLKLDKRTYWYYNRTDIDCTFDV